MKVDSRPAPFPSRRLRINAAIVRAVIAAAGPLCTFIIGIGLGMLSAGIYDLGTGWLALSLKLGLFTWRRE
jgi:hypothetical protein